MALHSQQLRFLQHNHYLAFIHKHFPRVGRTFRDRREVTLLWSTDQNCSSKNMLQLMFKDQTQKGNLKELKGTI